MNVLKSTQDTVIAALRSVAGIVERRHTLPMLCGVAATTITNGMPAGTVTEADTDSDSTGADGAPAAKAGDDDDGGESDGEPARPRTRINNARRAAAPLPAQPLRTAASSAGTTPIHLPASGPSLWKIDTVLQQYPVSRSAWYQGIKDGQYPKPVRIGARSVAWRSTEVLALIESLQTA